MCEWWCLCRLGWGEVRGGWVGALERGGAKCGGCRRGRLRSKHGGGVVCRLNVRVGVGRVPACVGVGWHGVCATRCEAAWD